MGDELIEEADPRKTRNDSKAFDELCPFYLSIGMSSAEYWEGDPSLPRYFREAFKMRQDRENERAWLYGLYVYDAVISAMTHLNSNKNSHKAYASKPYAFGSEDVEQEKQEKVVEAQAQAEVWLKSWASATQKQFKQ